jgi:hypothetical protein
MKSFGRCFVEYLPTYCHSYPWRCMTSRMRATRATKYHVSACCYDSVDKGHLSAYKGSSLKWGSVPSSPRRAERLSYARSWGYSETNKGYSYPSWYAARSLSYAGAIPSSTGRRRICAPLSRDHEVKYDSSDEERRLMMMTTRMVMMRILSSLSYFLHMSLVGTDALVLSKRRTFYFCISIYWV